MLMASQRLITLHPYLRYCTTVMHCSSRQVTNTYRILLLLHGGKQLWGHPGQRAAHVPAHKRCRLFLGQPQIGDFDDWSVEIPQITQQVVALQVKVNNSA